MLFARNARAHPNKAHKIWKGLPKEKHTSLSQTFANHGYKKDFKHWIQV